MTNIERTTSENKHFQILVAELDRDLAKRNGDANDFFMQYNSIDLLKNVVVVFIDGTPVGCGAMKVYDDSAMEIKRMFVSAEQRSKGIASAILCELEAWAKELGYKKCILETGNKMPEAIALYRKADYTVIPNYGQYASIESSICFEKSL
ncbi:GNAT family N-acetyltransferase [Filimonas effusa]|uniref:GNAT family N-acetyltransferase n=1 Tax=Filimonas effusa TaxID=2508721 RepID=A0A4Q1D496_9BACT|nr:GNAT family N-acetyltransferase [Filimonas effusa]RXK83168.1 GNAT family N-acetyltransferase [Filimonas effusa]